SRSHRPSSRKSRNWSASRTIRRQRRIRSSWPTMRAAALSGSTPISTIASGEAKSAFERAEGKRAALDVGSEDLGGRACIHRHDSPRYVPRAFAQEKRDGIGDVVDLGEAAQRAPAHDLFVLESGELFGHLRLDES